VPPPAPHPAATPAPAAQTTTPHAASGAHPPEGGKLTDEQKARLEALRAAQKKRSEEGKN
jgi:hypothetical protein